MKVDELILQLQQCDPSTEVRVGWSSIALEVHRVETGAFMGNGEAMLPITLLVSSAPPSQTEFDRVLLERDKALKDAQALGVANARLAEDIQRWTERMKVLQERLDQIRAITAGHHERNITTN